MDLIICYDLNSRIGIPYLGHWNDGTTSNKETVCTVLGENLAVKKGKGIEFVKILNDYSGFTYHNKKPNEYKNVEVICTSYSDTIGALFFAYDNTRNEGRLYIGHLNDGFVE
jgi:hypothetical protein